MGLFTSTSRVAEYYKRHGLAATVRRMGSAARRSLFANRKIVFYCDLAMLSPTAANVPDSLKIERVHTEREFSAEDRNAITNFWNPTLSERNMRQRFERGASLWLIRSEDRLAGYSWTLRGQTIADYYFPMGIDDIQIFDFFVFPKYRGRAVLLVLIKYMLSVLRTEGAARAYGDVAEWNHASLSFYKMTPFKRLGVAQGFTLFGRTFTRWVEEQPGEQAERGKEALRNARAFGGRMSDDSRKSVRDTEGA